MAYSYGMGRSVAGTYPYPRKELAYGYRRHKECDKESANRTYVLYVGYNRSRPFVGVPSRQVVKPVRTCYRGKNVRMVWAEGRVRQFETIWLQPCSHSFLTRQNKRIRMRQSVSQVLISICIFSLCHRCED